jgi:hypothetical protein
LKKLGDVGGIQMAEQARQTDPLIDVDHVEMTRYTGISGEIL